MAAQAEEHLAAVADPSPPAAPLLRRPSPGDPSPDAKRRRTCVAALESLEKDGDENFDSFSFEAPTITPIETTPKFGSFNPMLLVEATAVQSAPPTPPSEEAAEADGDGGEEGGASQGQIANSERSETE